ncbi:MAG: hypothetical protein PHE73_08760, partial [Sulfurovaceae bacterium]|nr:hypothetical protein [Sulfurovaceae bacterium]
MPLGDTYTPEQGSTMQGGQVADAFKLLSGLSTIPNPQQSMEQSNQFAGQAGRAFANMPQQMQQAQKGLMNQAQIPQMSNQFSLDMDTFTKMLQNDPLGQKQFLAANPYQNPADAIQGTGVIAAVPQLTLSNVDKPFAGFTNPVLAQQAQGAQGSGLSSIMSALGTAISGNLAKAGTQYSQDQSNYLAQIGLLTTLANQSAAN